MAFADQPGRIGGAFSNAMRRLGRGFSGGSGFGMAFSGAAPERLLLAPPDLRTPDPTIAAEIYAGIYFFGGRSVIVGGRNPFAIDPPTEAWARELHEFGWLRHLAAAGDPLSATNAQALVKEWIDLFSRPNDTLAWEAEVTARRLIGWLCHSILIIEKADLIAYRRFLKAVGQHISYLRSASATTANGMPRLVCQIALAYADLCVAMAKPGPRAALRSLDTELARQILPDGNHVSRNPAVLAELLALLLPLRQSLARAGMAPSTDLISAIDRMVVALRFMRLGDGSIAHFNGAGETQHSLVATVLRYDDVMAEIPKSAPYGGYQRLAAGDVVVLMDVGKAPPSELSQSAHAGILSFEMSVGNSPLVVNCGIPPTENPDAIFAARSSAAHSTIVLNDSSSCRFTKPGRKDGSARHLISAGPLNVSLHRENADDGDLIVASHDGYARQSGLVVERTIFLSANGHALAGTDQFLEPAARRPSRQAPRDAFSIRFHLHPSVIAERNSTDGSIVLTCHDGSSWMFQCEDAAADIEESIFFASPDGARRTFQIVIRGRAANIPEIRWNFSRI